jgi:hypothetical protein
MFGNYLQHFYMYYSVEECLVLKAHQCYTARLRVFLFSVVELFTASNNPKRKRY